MFSITSNCFLSIQCSTWNAFFFKLKTDRTGTTTFKNVWMVFLGCVITLVRSLVPFTDETNYFRVSQKHVSFKCKTEQCLFKIRRIFTSIEWSAIVTWSFHFSTFADISLVISEWIEITAVNEGWLLCISQNKKHK